MNVLHLYTDLSLTSGITRVIKDIITFGNNTDINYKVAALNGDAIPVFRKEGIDVLKMQYRANISGFFPLFFFLLNYCKKNKIDVIHSHHRYFDLVSSALSLFMNVRTITTVHSIVKGKRFLSYTSQTFVAVSNAVRLHLINYFHVDPSKICIIYNSVDSHVIEGAGDYQELRNKMGINENVKVLSFIGRLDEEKGVDILIYALARLAAVRKDFQCLFIGEGKLRTWMESQIKTKELSASIIPPQENIYPYYQLSDIIILPSRVDPFPMVMLEAGLMGKAFIGSRVDGIAELIDHERDGLLVEPENAESLFAAVKLLLDNSDLRNSLGNNLKNKIFNDYLCRSQIPEYYSLYTKN